MHDERILQGSNRLKLRMIPWFYTLYTQGEIVELYTVAAISLLAAISPGPDFFIVLRNSLVYSRKAGVMTACGITAALIVHLTYTLVGIGFLISQSPFIYSLLTKAGALYLLYIGLKGMFVAALSQDVTHQKSTETLVPQVAFMQGFLTNLLNPKCALFFISLFSQFITPTTPISSKLAYGFINWSITLCWFLLLAFVLTSNRIQQKLSSFRTAIDRIMGTVLVYLGFKLLFL